MTAFWMVFLTIACMSAWYLGYYMRHKPHPKHYSLSRDYLVGLNFLLNEEPDKAVDIFIKMLEVDSDTVETHLAVGKLFRRRGEVDRAIRIHQNLIARPQLLKSYRDQSLFELGQDYLSAGMLDRAERIFIESMQVKEYAVQAVRLLIDIYQQEKLWDNAIQMAKKLESVTHTTMQPVIAQYYCEKAEAALQKGQAEQGAEYIHQALTTDYNCARASLLQAKIDIKKHDFKAAIRHLKRVKDQNAAYLSEAVEGLAVCYEALGESEKLEHYLKEILKEHPHIPIVLVLSERIRRWQGDEVAASFVADYVRHYPSIRGLHLYINLHLTNKEGRLRDDLLILQQLMHKLLADKPDYRCFSCGFSGKTLYWLCPGCKKWSSIKPVHHLEECI